MVSLVLAGVFMTQIEHPGRTAPANANAPIT
jgi:hypothetical protein